MAANGTRFGILKGIGYENVEPLAMWRVIDIVKAAIKAGNYKPWLVNVIGDGVLDPPLEPVISEIIVESKSLPIFWKFLGLGGPEDSYGVLSRFDDDLVGRGLAIDNCDFQLIDNIGTRSNDYVYELLLIEYAKWIRDAKRLGILR